MNFTTRDYLFITAIVILCALLIFFINKDKSIIDENGVLSEKDCYILPKNIDPSVFGPKYWAAFHDLASKIPCNSCKDFAEKFVVFFHDLVNIKLGKPIYDVQNFNYMTEMLVKIKFNNNTWPA